jgi:hypothetical protein
MANSNLTPTVVTKEALTVLHNNITFSRNVNRQYDDSNEMGGQKNGGVIQIRLPNRYITSTVVALGTGENNEDSVALTQATQRHVDINFTTQELTQDIGTFSERVITPAISVLAAMFDYDNMQVALGVANSAGTPGTTPTTAAHILAPHTLMNKFSTPTSQRFGVIDPNANAAIVGGATNIFNTGGTGDSQYKSGLVAANQLGYQELSMSQSVRNLTTGTRDLGDTILVNGTLSTEGGTTISIDGGTTTATVLVGDVFTVAGCFSVNPETKQVSADLQQFVVTADNTASGGAWTNIAISPAIYVAGTDGRQNVDSFPTDGLAVTFLGAAATAYPQNIVYHKDSFSIGTTALEMPEGVHFSAREMMDGVSMRCVRQYRIGTDDIPTRIDILYGSVVTRPETACRLWG